MRIIKKLLSQKSLASQKGMTFVEVIAALGVLLTGIIGGLTLTVFNLNTSVASENRLLAANLAREAIEVIRQKRDSNWLANLDWYNGIIGDLANKYRLITKFDPAAASGDFWEFQDQTVGIENCSDCQLYYDSSNGVFSHDPDGDFTTFKRLITVNEICWQEMFEQEVILADGDHCQSYGLTAVGWQLTSQVTWHDNNMDHELKVIDRIFDWY